MTESQEQAAFVKWLELSYPKERFFAIPNEGKRNIATAMRMKREGLKAGVPDMYFPRLKLWIEMKKRKGGQLTKAQKSWIEYLKNIGDDVQVCKGFEEARDVFLKYYSI